MARFKTFQWWQQQEVDRMFDLRKQRSLNDLDLLLQAKTSFEPEEKESLLKFQARLQNMVAAWSEEDLKMLFISPVLNAADLVHDDYRIFFDYTIKAEINGEWIGGKVDCLLAKGYQIPEEPFFFLQEYKREKGRDTDPIGQLLAAMVVAQHLNKDRDTLYGCYIIGRNWFFVALKGQEYAISDAFVATQEDLFQIIAILRHVRALFEEKIGYTAV
ncbi:MAG: hypothetical protein L6Q97_02255 [Thermoanaerobaculia bacterium]|nr:hypothetical protein [Thermoanaerobaculia bacterium]